MIEAIASYLPQIIAALFGLAVLLLLLSLQQLRRGRTGPYWRLRRAAGQRGGQLFLISILLFGIATALAIFSGLGELAYQRLVRMMQSDTDAPRGVVIPSLTPTLRFTLTATASATATSAPTNTPPPATETPSPSPTLTATTSPTNTSVPTLSLTPTATFDNVIHWTPPPSTVQPPPGAMIEILTAASGISSDGEPVDSATQFPTSISRIYLFMDYRQMRDGIVWSRILYRDETPIQGSSYVWNLGQSGSSYFFFGSDTGYPPGEYSVRLFLGEQEIYRYAFTIQEA